MSSLAKDDQIRLIFEDQLDRREITLPILPEVAANVITLASSPDSDASQLANQIQGDMSLAGHVMRIAVFAVAMMVAPGIGLACAPVEVPETLNVGDVEVSPHPAGIRAGQQFSLHLKPATEPTHKWPTRMSSLRSSQELRNSKL